MTGLGDQFNICLLKNEIYKISSKAIHNNQSILPTWQNEMESDFIKKSDLIICGSTSKEEIRVLANNSNVLAIVDDELSKKWDWLFGIPLISTSQWIEKVKANKNIVSCILVTTLRATRHFIKQCIQYEFKYLTPIQILLILKRMSIKVSSSGLIFRYGLDYFYHTLNNIDELLNCSNIFSDEYSKIGYLNLLLYKLTLNPIYLETVAVGRGHNHDYNTYLFDRSYINFSKDEIYIDAGAYTGDSIKQFLFAVKGEFSHIYSFEPAPENNIEIINQIESLQQFYLKPLKEAITIIKKGVWSDDAELKFSTASTYDLGGHISESGISELQDSKIITIKTTSIDNATNQDATFIKFEVEGSELNGLIGAKKTIEKNKPKLAIAVYHKPEDFLLIPNYIENIAMNYKIGFKQHDLYKPDATYIYCY
jgi:FkbM family methyltransferase